MPLLLICIGAATGLLTGLTGASGMSILISSLLLAGMDVRDVIGLTFAVTLANAAAAGIPYMRNGHWDRRLSFAVGLPATAMVIAGNATGRGVPNSWLTIAMTVALFLIGLRFLFSRPGVPATADAPATPRPSLPALVGIGSLVGLVMGMMGGGGSIFISVALILLFKIPLRVALGSSILVMAMAAVPGFVLNLQQAHLDLGHAALLVIPGMLAATWGGRLANRVPERAIQLLLGSYLVIVSLVLVIRQSTT